MSLRDNELARRQDGRVELRPNPLRVRWGFNQLLTRDGHELRAVFTCSARALAEPTERRMLEEVLLGSRYSLTDDDLANHFEPALKSAAARASEQHTATEWTSGELSGQIIDALRSAAAGVAFGCGVELLPPFNVDLQSPTFQRQRLRAMEQSLAERQTAGQIEHVQRSAELLKQFQAIRAAAPDLSPGRVLRQISPSDQGAVLHTLLLASARERTAQQLWAVAGPYLVLIDTAQETPRPQLHPLPPTLGPLRSIQGVEIDGSRRLLAGAQSGLMLIDPNSPAEPRLYKDGGIASPLGFNAAVYWSADRGFAASHGDAGIVLWSFDQPDAPVARLRTDRLGRRELPSPSASGAMPTQGPRNLWAWDHSRLIFSSGSQVFLTDLQTIEPLAMQSSADVIAILPDDCGMLIVHADGTICLADRGTNGVTCLDRRSTRLRSAGALPWLGTTRLLLACEQGPVDCVGFDDPLVTQYHSAHHGLRSIAGSTDLVAGISADRQRLILWHSWEGHHPLTEIYLTGLTRHRIADVDFG